MALINVPGKVAESVDHISDWVDTAGITNIVVGVKGGSYNIEFHLGTVDAVYPAGKPAGGTTQIVKAAAVRVVNTGSNALGFEVLL